MTITGSYDAWLEQPYQDDIEDLDVDDDGPELEAREEYAAARTETRLAKLDLI